MTRTEIIDILKNNVAQVIFTKVDGTERTLSCTLKEDVIPKASKEDPLSQKKVREINQEVLPVWDIENNGWRSFRITSIIEVHIL